MLMLQPLIGLLLISLAHGDCPISFSPLDVVVEYGASFSVNCSSTSTSYQFGLSWEGFDEAMKNTENLYLHPIFTSVDQVMDWEMNLTCYMYSNETQCSQDLPITIYKTPDSVFISTVDHTGPMIKGNQYELQCDIYNVAPIQDLTVKWYKGQTLLNRTTFSNASKTPVNVTATLLIRPDRAVQYRCEAELDLGAEEAQNLTESSEPLNAEVYNGPCPFQIIPWRAVVRYGDNVSVDCKTSVPHQGMGWEASEGAVPMTIDQSLITWRVSELTEWDIQPFCYINHKEQCQVELPVTIYKTPDSVFISTVDHTGPMIEGNLYELQCDVLNVAPVQYLTVKWYKGQTLLNQTTFNYTIKTPVNETATLLICPDRADDGAQYRCEAELDLGEEGPRPPPKNTSDPLKITVYYAPQIQFCKHWSPLTETSLDSYPLHLYFVVGNPRPNISWSLNSSPVNSSMPLTKHDSGRYEITACNDRGNFSCSINITVEYPPELNCNESYEVKEKTLFKLPCTADGFPKPESYLNKIGKIIQHDFYPIWNDSGLYQLIAHNQHGTIDSNFTINILHAPVFYDSQEKFVVGENSNITLECYATGNPEPEIWWSFKNNNIYTGRRHINIERATSTHAGVYTCSATNKFGRSDKTFIVEIKSLGYDFPNYIIIVVVVFALLFLIIILVVLMWRRRKSRGHYEIQSVRQHEMRPLTNGGPK